VSAEQQAKNTKKQSNGKAIVIVSEFKL